MRYHFFSLKANQSFLYPANRKKCISDQTWGHVIVLGHNVVLSIGPLHVAHVPAVHVIRVAMFFDQLPVFEKTCAVPPEGHFVILLPGVVGNVPRQLDIVTEHSLQNKVGLTVHEHVLLLGPIGRVPFLPSFVVSTWKESNKHITVRHLKYSVSVLQNHSTYRLRIVGFEGFEL